jgi:predicted RNA methylase
LATASVTPKQIDTEVLTILSEMECNGDLALQYGKQLDREMYARLNKVLESLGGKWNRSRKGHVFTNGDASASLSAAVQFGYYIDPKTAYQDFPTPPELAAELVDTAMFDHGPSSPILEPSCGKGNIVQAMIDYGCTNIHAIDIRQECCDKVRPLINSARCADFLELKPKPMYRAIVMNPPFSKGQDIAHVRHAYDFLLTGGSLVAIMSPGFTFRGDGKFKAFAEWVKSVHGSWRDNPEGSFTASGTNVNTITFCALKLK